MGLKEEGRKEKLERRNEGGTGKRPGEEEGRERKKKRREKRERKKKEKPGERGER
jgi:hypothetical protein